MNGHIKYGTFPFRCGDGYTFRLDLDAALGTGNLYLATIDRFGPRNLAVLEFGDGTLKVSPRGADCEIITERGYKTGFPAVKADAERIYGILLAEEDGEDVLGTWPRTSGKSGLSAGEDPGGDRTPEETAEEKEDESPDGDNGSGAAFPEIEW